MKIKQTTLFLALTAVLLILFIGCTPSRIDSPPPSSTEPETTPTIVKNWELSNARYKIIEKNDMWWKFSYQVTVKNNTSYVVKFFITVNYLDQQGYIVDDSLANPPEFEPREQRTVRGYCLIDTEIAPDVRSIEAEVSSAYIQD